MQDLIICRCEEVTLKQLKDTVKQFSHSAREVKLRTRAGMGFCGGRTCRPMVDQILLNLTDETPSDAIPLKVQPPVRPTALAHLGGSDDES